MNKNIINNFNNLIFQINFQLDDDKNNLFRLKSLEHSLSIIKKFNKNLKVQKNIDDLKKIKGIGKGTIDRIIEINNTGKLSEVFITKKSIKSINELSSIYGIGKNTAVSLLKQGIKSYSDLTKAIENNSYKPSRSILLGVKYFKTFKEHIPRAEMNKHKTILSNEVKKISDNLVLEVCGSYRRKLPFSNDIDCVLSYNGKSSKNYLKLFVNHLIDIGYVTDCIDADFSFKFLGFCKGDKYFRRIDISFVPFDSYYSNLLYFTGNKYFNLYLRNIAKAKGYKLSEFGLFKNNKKLPVHSEKDIFDILGVDYLPPDKRNF